MHSLQVAPAGKRVGANALPTLEEREWAMTSGRNMGESDISLSQTVSKLPQANMSTGLCTVRSHTSNKLIALKSCLMFGKRLLVLLLLIETTTALGLLC